MYPETFEGFCVQSHENWSDFKSLEFIPKPFEKHDVDISIECCSICGSDIHTLTGGWGPKGFPLCVGHEIIGEVIRVGALVTLCKVGDRVGVGAQALSCFDCKACKTGNENYCAKRIGTYGVKYSDGVMSQGGFASHVRVHEHYTVPIPDGLPSSAVAPLMCAGVSVFGPLRRANIGPGSKVAVLGIGGLGHLALQFARALGAEVSALSHSANKEPDAKACGAHHFVLTSAENWHKPLQYEFDFIMNTVDVAHTFNLLEYFSTLRIHGTFHFVGIPDAPFPDLKAFNLLFLRTGANISGNHIGNRSEMISMLEVAKEHGIRSWIEEIQLGEEGCKNAVERLNISDARFRFTLVGYDRAFSNRVSKAPFE